MTLVTGFAEPVFYLFSIGIGLGALVQDVTTDGGTTVPYAVFVAPALLAASAMNGAIFDSTFNVFFKLKYSKLYDSVLATPLGPRDIAVGEIGWSLMRGDDLLRGVPRWSRWLAGAVAVVVGVLALPAAMLIGFAFAAVGMCADHVHAVLGRLRLRQPRDPADVPVLGDVLPARRPTRRRPRGWSRSPRSTRASRWSVALMLGEVDAGLLWHVVYFVVLGSIGLLGTARRLERLLLS